MSEDKSLEEDPYGDLWRWENQCFEEFENQPSYESQLQQERDLVNQKLWHLFQNSATCIAQLHKGGSAQGERNTRWMPFQTAAGSVTALYKESVDSIRRCTELGIQHGQQRRTRELVAFLRRRRLIRREDLLAFLSGKPPPPAAVTSSRHSHRSSPRPHLSVSDRASPRLSERSSPLLAGASILVTAAPAGGHDCSDGLQPFRDALALSSLQGAMSAVSFRPPSPAAASAGTARRRHSPARRGLSGSPAPSDSVKRPATPSSPSDVIMDSPTHKRPRLT
ncbi:UPF0472 protein C16orf72 homolog isoform X3 [Amphibalanus amphitrite]|uniref:UPF0472 protein C16orf72 homolog isoform X3 n=1 Tax=Amphibalanus amphitrite TaxID=1232801 RepID=UPI001C9150E5|nr:UPF0472 protein C16orf72 homolog isoform X3 [Amphibalanus amphitrite]